VRQSAAAGEIDLPTATTARLPTDIRLRGADEDLHTTVMMRIFYPLAVNPVAEASQNTVEEKRTATWIFDRTLWLHKNENSAAA